MTPADMALALRRGDHVPDAEIDAHLSPHLRAVASRWFTPTAVAARAARVLEDRGARTVLDVGSGAGKLCCVAALASDLELTGIEQRAPLVLEALHLAQRLGVAERVRFVRGTIHEVDLTAYDALYVFNSFAENLFPAAERLDASVELSAARMARDLEVLERALDELPLGGSLMTYHGFGGQVPDTFDLVHEESAGSDRLRMFTKRRTISEGACWVEVADDVMLVERAPPEERRLEPRTYFQLVSWDDEHESHEER